MQIGRRQFLAGTAGAAIGGLGAELTPEAACAASPTGSTAALTATICTNCSVGCGALVAVADGKLVSVEGDPAYQVNAGALCARGLAMVHAANSRRRVTTVRYRAPGAAAWEEKDWNWALEQIGRRIQTARGAAAGQVETIACLAGSVLGNEESGLVGDFARALGIVYVDHEDRLGPAAAAAALRATFGGGAMPHRWSDLTSAGCILAIGANVAESHPIAFHWITAARAQGAKLVCVDPRLTRTAATADLHVPLRPGTDIALVGGLIHYLLEHDRIDRDYLRKHTDASWLVDPQFVCAEGRFGPLSDGRYTREHWGFQRGAAKQVRRDPTLGHHDCVLQALRRHFARYTLESVSQICGTPLETLRQLAEMLTAADKSQRPGIVLCGNGATQHSHGTQNVRAYAILQMLLGHAGVPGGIWSLHGNIRAISAHEQSFVSAFEALHAGKIRGLIAVRQNPAVCGPDASHLLQSLERLQWLVVADEWETETAAFWKRPGAKSEEIKTEVFLLPAADALEKAGSTTNAEGREQRRVPVVPPRGAARAEAWIIEQLARRVKVEMEAKGAAPFSPGRKSGQSAAALGQSPARLFAPDLADGPLPEHYEPLESPAENLLSATQSNPLAKVVRPDELGNAKQYPLVATACSMGELSTPDAASRNEPLLTELVPEPFVEISRELAKQKGIKHGDLVNVRSTRGQITLRAVVTPRLKAFQLADRLVEQVALVGHFGSAGAAAGPSINSLVPAVCDPNSMTPEYKAFLCDVEKAVTL
jgi:anaerobic selenocysteine-containing dehydrogenase